MKIPPKSKKAISPPGPVAALISILLQSSDEQLKTTLKEIDSWKWPRTDLNAWIKVLNRFDDIMDAAIREYNVDKLQLVPFSQSTKELLSEVLRFERLLLEYSTNRKTFNSYDRLNSLLSASDLDVVILALNVLLRPSQQYSAQPSVSHALSISTTRLQSLAKRWAYLREHGIGLLELATNSCDDIQSVPLEAKEVNFTFYRSDPVPSTDKVENVAETPSSSLRKSTIAAPAPNSNAIQIRLDEQTIVSQPVMNVLSDAIQTYNIPEAETFELLCRIRASASLTPGKKAEREKLLIIRLLAIAIYGHTHPESQATSALFLYEPDLIAHISDLLQIDKEVPIPVQTAAIAALDALARYKARVQEVLTAVNAGVNHGVLLALVRKMVIEVADPDSRLPHSFIEALLSFITYLASHASGGNMVVGAGLIPLLIQIIENRNPSRLAVISKTMQLVDNVIYSFTNAFSLFCASRGVESLVERIEYEIDHDIKECSISYEPCALSGIGELPTKRIAVLKHMLRSMHRMMQSSGTAEGLRNLIDTSLLKSINKIVRYRGLFGPSIFPLAINIMSTFVHNEPTSLAIIQEAGLPTIFYQALESGIEPAIEVIQAIPNAIGALCLNEIGQAQLSNHPSIIPSIISIFTSERHIKVLLDKENAVVIGTAVDELIRHHPTLKQAVFEALKSAFSHLENIGMAYSAPTDLKQWYQLVPVSQESNHQDVFMRDVTSLEAADATAVDETSQNDEEIEDAEEGPHDNIIVSYIDVLGRFLEGFFQHPLHCKDFVLDTDGLQRIGRLTALPCLPYDFANSVASDSMVQVLRTMAEVATNDTLSHLIDLVRRSLADTKFFWESMDDNSKLSTFVDHSEEGYGATNQQFRNLVTLHIRITLLSDVLATAGQSQGRAAATGFWLTLMNSIPRQVLADLGALHRASLWENIIFQAGLAAKGIELPSSPLPLAEESSGVATTSVPATDGTIAAGVNASAFTSKPGPTKHQGPQALNASALKHITNGLPNALAPFFQAVVRMFHARRNADSNQRDQMIGFSKVIAEILLNHLSIRNHEDKASLYYFYSLVLELFVLLLTDDRGSTNTLHTVQLLAFYRIGGFDAIFDICEKVVSHVDALAKVPEDARTDDEKRHLLHAYGTIKLILHLLHPVISSKPLFESSQTPLIVTRDKKDTDPDYFEPHNFLVRVRSAALPLVHRLWGSTWLAQAPVGVGKYVVRSVLEIANGENEEFKGDGGEVGNLPPVPRSSGPTETQIRMLTDMGFPRSAAERALTRTNNDMNSATEYLLSRPFPFPPDPPEPEHANPPAEEQSPDTSDESSPSTPEPPSPQILMAEGGSSTNETLPGKTSDEWRKLLNEAREPLRANISKRALSLIDEHLSLLFDLHVVFTKRSNHQGQAIRNLIDDISSFSTYAYDVQEQPLANRCRLLALVLCERPEAFEPDLRSTLMDRLLALLLSTRDPEHPPKWLAAHLLVTEALLTLADEPLAILAPKEGEVPVPGPISVGPSRPDAQTMVFDFCLQLLANDDLPADELLSILRLFVLLTRDRQMAAQFIQRDGPVCLFQRLRKSAVTGASSYIASILRHLVEDAATIQNIMQQTIKRYFSQPRTRLVDLASYVRNCSAIALRDKNIFIDVTKSMCQVEGPYSPSPHIKLQPDVQANDKLTPIETSGDMQVDTTQAVSSSLPHKAAEGVIHQLISELMSSTKVISEGEATVGENSSNQNPPDTAEIPIQTAGAVDVSEKQQYLCFVMQCLTELLFSYDSCKVAFLSYSAKKRTQQPQAKDTKFRNTTLHFLLSELITYATINPTADPKYRSRTTLCSWAMNVVGALCVDTSTAQETKEVSPDLILVRKFVLETVSRAIKDAAYSVAESTEARYGRLLALGDLCHRLLTVRVNVNTRKQQQDEIPTHLAKIMLEKNFVSTLTTALSEVDLNYPNVRNLVASILRPLEYLSKIAMKMSKASGKNKEDCAQVEATASTSEDEDEVMDDVDARDETPDLYRNSALGMYGGEMDDRQYSDDEDMEDAEDDQDVEMEYGEATGSEETSESESESDGDALEEGTHVSGDGWGEGDEEEDLVEDRDDDGDDDDDDEPGQGADDDQDNEEDEGGGDDAAGIMWEDIQQPETLGMLLENADDEQGLGVPIQINHEGDEPDLGSDEDELLFDHAHFNNDSLIDLGNAVINHGQGLFIQRRHRGNEQSGFGRSRNAPSAPEVITHPLLLDVSAQNRSNVPSFSRSIRGGQRFLSNAPPAGLLEALDEVLGEASLQAINHINHIIHHGGGGIGGIGGMLHIQVPVGMFPQTRRLLAGTSRPERTVRTTSRQGREFDPLLTLQRWAEEMKIVHGDFVNERAGKLTNHLLLAMLPAALEILTRRTEEAKLKAEEEKEKEKKKAEEEEVKNAEEAEPEAEEAIPDSTREMRSAIEDSTVMRDPAPGLLLTGVNNQEVESSEPLQGSAVEENLTRRSSDSEMADVTEPTPSDPQQVATEPPAASMSHPPAQSSSAAANRERVTVMIHGGLVDITDTGIDPTFLEALPDDMREEVLNQHVRDQQAGRVERPPDSQISVEFLDALPPDIRAEIIQQEAMERSRRRTEETSARPAVREASDIDPASFIASLDPSLRQAVLLEQDDTFLRTLPSHMIAEAGVYRDELQARRTHASRNPTRPIPVAPSVKKYTVQHDAIQLLDRLGLAILVRLLFYPQVLKKTLLFKVLVNLCENMKTRTELFNLLLSILQDGTGDLTSVDKSFSQMTVRSRDSKLQTPKALKQRSADCVPPLGVPMSQIETVPDLIAQRCLEALTFIVNANESSSLFFLTEHDVPAGLRKPLGKKGKGKEKQASYTHYPLVLLLNLLDRQTLLRTPAILESVVGLLATITRPLTSLKEPSKPFTDALAQETDDNSNLPPVSQQAELNPMEPLPQIESVMPDSSTNILATSVPGSEPQLSTENKIPGKSEDKNVLPRPPHVPHGALRFIVNILTTGECSSRTFQQSLALIQNLSSIPDARDVIASELKTKAQDFGQTLYSDLDELALALQEGLSQIITSSVTTKFSPASSTQAKLLRVLKTIDYMYTPKPVSTSSTAETASKEDVEKVQAIYESFCFTPLWRRLGDCLFCIGENPETEHIATVLLPLIESLMVVCKFVGSKGPISRAMRVAVSPRSPVTPRESMEELFVSFTDAHRKVLNLMVRNNPSLMSGSFSLLINNSRVLDFDNKRNYFNQQLHRRPHMREHHSTLQLNIRRARVFEDSFLYLQRKSGDQIKYGKLSVRFYDEEGVDAGGLTREWFQILARQMFNPNYALFQPCAADKLTYQPNKASWVNPEHLSFFKFVGRVIGKAIYDGRLLDAYFARSLYRQILGKPVDYKDVEWIDPEYYNSLCWILENDPTVLELTFSIEADEFGVNKIVALKEGGEQIQVTQENKREYVQLSAQYRLYSSIKDQIESLLSGFYEIIPKDLITIFNEQELELLISGTPDIDVDEWRAATEYNGYTSSDPNIVWWWRALKSFNREERAKVLSFATGTSRVPLNGFLDLQGVQGVQKFSIHRAYGEPDRLPQAHTCFNQIDLPQYTSYEMLRQQLLLAINEGGEGFGFS